MRKLSRIMEHFWLVVTLATLAWAVFQLCG